MTKSELIAQKPASSEIFPCLRQHSIYNFIVLFVKDQEGTVVYCPKKLEKTYYLGLYNSRWGCSLFECQTPWQPVSVRVVLSDD